MSVGKNPFDKYSSSLYKLAREGRFPHAVIIECADSAEGCNTAMKIAANALCTGKRKEPCGECGNCVKININSHSDVKIIYPQKGSTSIKIDDIRFVREDAHISSNEGSYKFYIIADADCLTVQAQNALIKILEEPPSKVIFIILCRSSLSLLETVRSRSQIFGNSNNPALETDSKLKDLAENIVDSSLKRDKCSVIRCVSSVPNDRLFFKNLINEITENFLKAYSFKSNPDINSEKLIKVIDELQYIAGLIDKNINFNLIASYLCACL